MPYLRGKHEAMTREEKNAYQRQLRAKTGNAYTKRYEKTMRGFLMRCHRNMRSRALGIQTLKAHLYSHITTIIDKEAFYKWSMNDAEFLRLWDEWKRSDHDRRLTPSIDRIDTTGGYEPENIRWITHSENSRLGAMKKKAR